jgi:hypothetical protein
MRTEASQPRTKQSWTCNLSKPGAKELIQLEDMY